MTIAPTDDRRDQHVLVLAPAGRDATLTRELLAAHGLTADVCPDLESLCGAFRKGAGVIIVAEEALFPHGLDTLVDCVSHQPPWSDIPIIVFLRGGATGAAIDRLHALPNLSVLERPVRLPALVATIRSALRARARQYEVRRLMTALHDANRAKDDFLAMVSHELRTPLNVIRGMSHVLASQTADQPRVHQAVERLRRNADVLLRLVEDLLDLSRLQKKRFQLQVGPVDLTAVLNSAIEMNHLAADAKGIRIKADLGSTTVPMQGDALRLQQVFSNLLSNAIKFTPSGGSVTVRLRATDTNVRVTVEDTGEGIEPALLSEIFEPFRQGTTDYRAAGFGLGLGLAIVRRFVELHGGSVSAASKGAGQGAVFVVELPLHREYAAAEDRSYTPGR